MKVAIPPVSCKVYTPEEVAEAMVRAIGDEPRRTWLEPSHGTGVFVEALARMGVERSRLVAVDLDRKVAAADKLATTFRGVDFLCWATETDRRFDRIVGNPPFVSISDLPSSLQRSAESILDLDGQPVGKGANVWYAFLVASIRLLRPGGCLAFVLPSAAEFADYALEVRCQAVKLFASLELFRCKRPLFDEVQEGTLVGVARGYGLGPGVMRRRWFETRVELIAGLSQSGQLKGRKCPTGPAVHTRSTVPLGSVAKIGLGGVTGDASFFLMNEEKRKSLGLPKAALSPVVSKARHLRSAILTQEEWQDLNTLGERIWLLNPSDRMAAHPNVKEYLSLEVDTGGCNLEAYKVSIRDPWYRTMMPDIPDAFLSGMSQHGPWLCINESKNVNATNTLYVVRFESRDRNDWYMWALALLSSGARRQIRRIARRYPDGLLKYEPGSLAKVALPQPKLGLDHKSLYLRATAALLAGETAQAREIADSALSKP